MCPRCGASVQPEWTFCRDCGYAPDAAAVEPDLDDTAAPIEAPPASSADATPDASPDLSPGSRSDWPADAPGDASGGSPFDAPPAPSAAPGFGPSPGFGAPGTGPGASGTDLPIVGSWNEGDAPAPADAASWAAPQAGGFDAPAPSSFSAGAGSEPGFDPPVAPGFGPGPGLRGEPGPDADAFAPEPFAPEPFDPAAFDPDALAGTPYEEPEPEPEPAAPAPPVAPAPITFQSTSSGPPGLPASFGGDAPPPRPPVGGAPGGGASSPFSINRAVAIGAVAIGALILVGGILLLTGGSKDAVSTTGTPGKTTPPPLGAIAVTSTTVVDPLAPVSTTTSPPGAQRDCDTIAIMHSVDGSDFTPCTAGFKVRFPGRPDTHVTDADISMGHVQFNVHSSTNPDPLEPIRYEVGWATLPKEPTPEEAVEAMGALTATMGCSLTGPITFQDQPAYSCKGAGTGAPDPKNPTVALGIAFVRGNHVYAVMATAYTASQKQLDAFAATFTPV
jgi:hypothetical protein